MDLITHIYYINLDTRKDRNAEILEQFQKQGITNYTRISAIRNMHGCIGCSQSHIYTLKEIMRVHGPLDKSKSFLILEDDFTFHDDFDDERVRTALTNAPDYHVILFSGYVLKKAPGPNEYLDKCLCAQTTSGYLVRGDYVAQLLKNYEEGLKQLLITFVPMTYAIDMYWKRLQHSRWYIMRPLVGYQRESYSDCECKIVNPKKIY